MNWEFAQQIWWMWNVGETILGVIYWRAVKSSSKCGWPPFLCVHTQQSPKAQWKTLKKNPTLKNEWRRILETAYWFLSLTSTIRFVHFEVSTEARMNQQLPYSIIMRVGCWISDDVGWHHLGPMKPCLVLLASRKEEEGYLTFGVDLMGLPVPFIMDPCWMEKTSSSMICLLFFSTSFIFICIDGATCKTKFDIFLLFVLSYENEKRITFMIYYFVWHIHAWIYLLLI